MFVRLLIFFITVPLLELSIFLGLGTKIGMSMTIAIVILTGFLGAILLGLGIDHGIHLLERFAVENDQRSTFLNAIRRSYGDTMRAVLSHWAALQRR